MKRVPNVSWDFLPHRMATPEGVEPPTLRSEV
jgi:hypothetical protein